MYVRDDIPSKEIKASFIRVNTEGITIELNFRKSKSLLLTAYKPPDIPKANWFHNITKALDFHGSKYENITLMGDLNIMETNKFSLIS